MRKLLKEALEQTEKESRKEYTQQARPPLVWVSLEPEKEPSPSRGAGFWGVEGLKGSTAEFRLVGKNVLGRYSLVCH